MPKKSPKHAYDEVLVALGEAIRRSREAIPISQEGLANESFMDRAYVGAIERGEHNIGVLLLLRIAVALDMKMSELLAEAGL